MFSLSLSLRYEKSLSIASLQQAEKLLSDLSGGMEKMLGFNVVHAFTFFSSRHESHFPRLPECLALDISSVLNEPTFMRNAKRKSFNRERNLQCQEREQE